MRTFAPTLRVLRRAGLALGLLGTALATQAIAPPSAAAADPDFVFGDQWFYEGTTNFGDLPDCGADNIDGHDDGAAAHWEVLSTVADGDEIEPGDQFVIRADVSGGEQSTGDNGPSPLGLHLLYNGPVEVLSLEPAFEPGPGEVVHGGDESVGPIGQVNATEFRWDVNSNPGVFEASDGAHVRMDITFRAVAEGTINITDLRVNGYDGTPSAGNFSCGVDLDWSFAVDAVDPPTSGPDNARTDANYSFDVIGDGNAGDHTIGIPVLANDNDPEVAGGPGSTAEVRIHDWTAASAQGGTVSCGTAQQKNNPTFAQMSTGLCQYTPPFDLPAGTNDSFTYVVRSVSGKERSVVVNVDLVDNVKPYGGNTITNVPGTGGNFVLAPKDVTNDDIECDAAAAIDTTPAGHTVTINGATCEVSFSAGNSGEFTFPYRACDRHDTLAGNGHGSIGASLVLETQAYADGDLNDDQSARCSDFTATVRVAGAGGILPPNGVSDFDVVDAGYAGDGIGAYTIVIPVLANDTDGNGVQPSDPAFNGTVAILDGPDASEGTATVDVDREIVFTPADGFEGPVEFTYNVGEDPQQQNPTYQGLPFAGVGTVAVFVIGNPAPIAVDDAVLTNSVDDVVDLDVGANDSDPEGEALECTPGALVAAPAGIVESASIGADCLVDLTPVEGAAGVASLTYEVCDNHVLADPDFPAAAYGDDGRDPLDDAPRCAEAAIEVTVASDAEVLDDGIDDPDPDPTCVADAASTPAGTAVTVAVLGNDGDTTLAGEIGPLTVASAGIDGTEEVTTQGGSVVIDGTGAAVRYTPRSGFTGVDTFVYTAQDSVGQTCDATVTVQVTALAGTTTTTGAGTGGGALARTGTSNGVGQLQLGVGLALAGFGLVLIGGLGRTRRPGGTAA